jgi:hypothetical protein
MTRSAAPFVLAEPKLDVVAVPLCELVVAASLVAEVLAPEDVLAAPLVVELGYWLA